MGKLQEYRERLNLTQDELAEKAGVSGRTKRRRIHVLFFYTGKTTLETRFK